MAVEVQLAQVTLLAAAVEHLLMDQATQAALETAVMEVLVFRTILTAQALHALAAVAVVYGLVRGLVVMEALEAEVEVLIAQTMALMVQHTQVLVAEVALMLELLGLVGLVLLSLDI